MDWALWKLLWLRQRGGLRRRLQALKTLRGLALTAIGVGCVALWILGSSLASGHSDSLSRVCDVSRIRTTAADTLPILLLLSCLLTAATTSGPAIYFGPSEVNFLFAGPFSRRSLLIYKFLSYAIGAVLSSFCLSLVLPRPLVAWLAVFVGTFLTLLFVQLFSAALGLVGQVLSLRLMHRFGWLVTGGCLVLVAVAWWHMREQRQQVDLSAWFGTLQQTPGVVWLLTPFRVFSHCLMADSLVELIRWGSIAAMIDAGLLTLIVGLDADYYEAVEEKSRRMRERWLQYRRGRLFAAQSVRAGIRIPQPPRLGGVGPLVWRQMSTAWRTHRRSLLILHAVAAGSGMLLATALQQGLSPWSVVGVLAAGSVVVLPRALIFDFRGDADLLSRLKGLPVRSMPLVLGQVLTPATLATTIHWSVLAGAVACVSPPSRVLLLSLAVIAPPMNFLHYALENLVFLFHPARVAPVGRVDFEFFGRTLVETMVKMFTIAFSMMIGLLAVSRFCPEVSNHPIAAVLVFASALSVQGLTVACLAAWAFGRLDVSQQSLGDG